MELILISFLALCGLSLVSKNWAIPLARLTSILSLGGAFFLYLNGWSSDLNSSIPLLPSLGVYFELHVDGLSYAFGCLILVVGSAVFWYSSGYLPKIRDKQRFLSSLILFQVSMLGLVFSNNFFFFFLFWELTSLSSFLLVALKDEEDQVVRASKQVFLTTVFGGFCLLAGLLWMQSTALAAGLSIQEASRFSSVLQLNWMAEASASWIFILLFLGAITKSAQFPFHFWLPQAMAAPTPVSSFLHSATMVKAGVFLLAKIFIGFGSLEIWFWLLVPFGLLTAFASAVLCLYHTDMKKILAYTTLSVLGILTALLGLGTNLALEAMIVFLFGHALYKAALFQVVGNIELSSGSKDLRKAIGLWSPALRITAIAGILAALSNAGAPPLFGFIGKELVLKASLLSESMGSWFLAVIIFANLAMMIIALLIGIRPFLKQRASNKSLEKPLSWSLQAPPLILAVLGLVLGIFPQVFDRNLGLAMLSGVQTQPAEMHLSLWHGFAFQDLLILGISLVSLGLAVFLARVFWQWRDGFAKLVDRSMLFQFETCFEKIILILSTSFLQIKSWVFDRSRSMFFVYFILYLIGLSVFIPSVEWNFLSNTEYPSFNDWGTYMTGAIFILILGSMLAVFWMNSFISVAICTGLIGSLIALVFVWLGAPDLAVTQLLAEILIAVLLAVLMGGLKPKRFFSLHRGAILRALIAAGTGVFLWTAMRSMDSITASRDTAAFFSENAAGLANGLNVVNVILVDFRATDTLVEVMVVLVAVLGVRLLWARENIWGKN